MSITIRTAAPLRALAWAFSIAAGAVAAWLSYGFGMQLGGAWMGVVAAINGAAMGALLASALVDRLQRYAAG
jgi:hypothetical protein